MWITGRGRSRSTGETMRRYSISRRPRSRTRADRPWLGSVGSRWQRDAEDVPDVLYVRPRFTRGHGFGNRLFPWARARVFAATTGARFVTPLWTRFAVG